MWLNFVQSHQLCPRPQFLHSELRLIKPPMSLWIPGRYASVLLAEYRRIVGAWIADCGLCRLCVCLGDVRGWDYLGSSVWSIWGIRNLHDLCRHTVGISRCPSVMHRPPRLHMLTEVDSVRSRHMTYPAWRFRMRSKVRPSFMRLMAQMCAICRPDETTLPVTSVAACCTFSVQFQHLLLDQKVRQWDWTSHSLG